MYSEMEILKGLCLLHAIQHESSQKVFFKKIIFLAPKNRKLFLKNIFSFPKKQFFVLNIVDEANLLKMILSEIELHSEMTLDEVDVEKLVEKGKIFMKLIYLV